MGAPDADAGSDCDAALGSSPAVLLGSEWFNSYAHHLQISGDRLLYASSSAYGDEIRVMKTTPSTPVTLKTHPRIDGIATNGESVFYFARGESIWETDFGGAFPSIYSGRAIGIAVDSRHLFWTENGISKDNRDGRLKRAVAGLGAGSSGTEVAFGPLDEAIAMDATDVYCISSYRPLLDPSEQVVVRVPRGDGDLVNLAIREGSWEQEIALTSTSVVALFDGPLPEILAVSKSGETTSVLRKPPKASSPHDLRTRGEFAYWIEGSTIQRAAVDGKTPAAPVWSGSCSPTSIAVDDAYVYWLTSTPGKKSKPKIWRAKL